MIRSRAPHVQRCPDCRSPHLPGRDLKTASKALSGISAALDDDYFSPDEVKRILTAINDPCSKKAIESLVNGIFAQCSAVTVTSAKHPKPS